MSGALEGILVADFSRVLAGPLATMHLADLGATVVKVERPEVGDDTRSWGPPWSPTSSTYFDSVNRGKRSLTLDLSDEGDRQLAHELSRRADVLVENFRPGALDHFGLGFEQVVAGNPGVVYASVTGFGRAGGADLMGYDFLVQAVGGLMSVTGEPDGAPTKTGVAVVDVLTGKDLMAGVLAALVARGRTGQGCRVEVDLLSSLLAAMVNQGQSTLATGTAPGPMGNRHPSITPYETLRCGDGPRFATNSARIAHRADLVQILESLLAVQDSATWQRSLTRAGVPAGRVGDLTDGFALAESLGLHPWTDVGEPGAPCPQVRHPVQYAPALSVAATAPPQLGEHDAQLCDWLRRPAAPIPPLPAHRIPPEEVHQ